MPPNGRKLVEGEAPTADRQAAHPNLLPPYQKGENSRTGEPTRRGSDRKPRQIHRLALTRALVAARQKNGGPPVPGIENLALGYGEILADHRLENRGHFLRLGELIKETFDDAPDSGSGRTTVFLFPSEVEEERRRAAGLPRTEPPPAKAAGPLAGLEEVEE